MEILHLAKANIRKNKSNSITLAILVLVVSMLAGMGLTVMTQISSAYDKKADELNSSHYTFGIPRANYDTKYENFFKNDPRVTDYNMETTVIMEDTHIDFGGGFDATIVLLNKDIERRISPLKLLEEDTGILPESAIYLPYFGKIVGYSIGDTYSMTYKNKQYDFVVSGFFESTEMSKTSAGFIKHYLSDEAFNRMKDEMGEGVLITTRFSTPSEDMPFSKDFMDKTELQLGQIVNTSTISVVYENGKLPTITPIMTFAGMLVGFAFIAVLISLLVINFRVSNSIEDRIRNIGVLGATGYTRRQISTSFLLEYALISLPAALLGVGIAAMFTPGINSMLVSMTGLMLKINPQIAMGLIASAIIALLLLAMVLLAGRRVKHLPPVVALRGGLASHNFRRNFFPLHKGFGSANLRLGMKNMVAYRKLYLMIGVIIAGIALVVTFVAMTYINFSVDQTGFIEMIGMEISDVTVAVTKGTDANALAKEIETMDDVRKVGMLDLVSFKIEGTDSVGYISNDFTTLETVKTFEGSFPSWDNEIVIPETLAKTHGKKIGDAIDIKCNGIVKQFLISGYFSTTNNGGNIACMSEEGYRSLKPDYQRNSVNVYLNEGVKFEDFSAKLQERFGVVNLLNIDPNDKHAAAKARAEEKISAYLNQYGINSAEYAVSYNGEIILKGGSSSYKISKISNWREYLETQINSYATTMPILMTFISLVSLLLIALVLYMTVKTIVSKRRVELGTLKAGGFQTSQLVVQMAISFMPAAILGAVLGCFGGAALVNPAFIFIFSSIGGVSRANFIISPTAIGIIFVGLCLVTFVISTLSALRIKNISVYDLLSE